MSNLQIAYRPNEEQQSDYLLILVGTADVVLLN